MDKKKQRKAIKKQLLNRKHKADKIICGSINKVIVIEKKIMIFGNN